MSDQDRINENMAALPDSQKKVLESHLEQGWELFDVTPEGWLTLKSTSPELGASCVIRDDGRTVAFVQGAA